MANNDGTGPIPGRGASTFPLVSVLVPLYNHAKFVEQCLESIVSEGYPNKEIIVLDDGSSDASLDIVHAWHEANGHRLSGPFVIISRENRGVIKTLNELVARSGGTFIVPVASDDYLKPDGIRTRLDYLLAHPEKMAVIGDCIVVDHDNNKLYDSGLTEFKRGRKAYLAHEKLIDYELVFRWCVPGPVFMARRELYREVGEYREGIAVEDRDFFLRLVARGLLGFVDFPVAAYRIHAGGFTSTPARELIYKEAMYVTVTENLSSFSGLRRLFLLAYKMELSAEVARLNGNEGVMLFFRRTVGRLCVSFLKRIYTAVSPLMYRMSGSAR